MMWLDFFLQVFVHALAWCLAVAIGVAVGGVLLKRALRPRTKAWRRGR